MTIEVLHGPVAITYNGKPIVGITGKRLALLSKLIENSPNVVTRTVLLEEIWGYNFDPKTNILDVTISKIKKDLKYLGLDKRIVTRRGAGYRWRGE